MEALVAAVVFVPITGAVTVYNAWALYRACRDRFFGAGADRAHPACAGGCGADC
jgi:hypothetical protein